MARSCLVANLAIEAVHTAVPTQMTDPKFSHKVSLINNNGDQTLNLDSILQTRMNVVVLYKKQSNGDSGWHVGGWIKETLGKALVQNPILAGRFRRSEDGGMEIVSNDNGVRCLEAQISLSLDEFLQSKDETQAQAQLVHWKDVDQANPQYSPIFYVQVTNFQCGGYSVGLSYNLLLADPLLMENFLKKWSELNKSMAFDGEIPKMPLFYSPNFKQNSPLATKTSNFTPSGNASTTKTTMFSISTNEKLIPGDEICKCLVLHCIEEAEGEFGTQMGSKFTLITKKPSGDVQVENSSKEDIFGYPKGFKYELSRLKWEDLKTKEISFRRENVAVDVSHWVVCDSLQAVVLLVISSHSEDKFGITIYVVFPSKMN